MPSATKSVQKSASKTVATTGKASTRTPASKTVAPIARGTTPASSNAVALPVAADKSGPPHTGPAKSLANDPAAVKAALDQHEKDRASAARTGKALADPENVTPALDQRRPSGGPESTEPGQIPDAALIAGEGHKTAFDLRRAKSDKKVTAEEARDAIAALEEVVSFGPGTVIEINRDEVKIRMPNNRTAHGATWQQAFTDLWRIQAGGL